MRKTILPQRQYHQMRRKECSRNLWSINLFVDHLGRKPQLKSQLGGSEFEDCLNIRTASLAC